MKHEGVDVSITGNSTNPTRFQHLVAGAYKKWSTEHGKDISPLHQEAVLEEHCILTTWRQVLHPMV